jgi:cbb3-type cytochrome oxidase subunit 1
LDWFRTGLTMWYYLFIIISINFIHLINYLYNPTEIWRSIKLRPHDPSLYFADV